MKLARFMGVQVVEALQLLWPIGNNTLSGAKARYRDRVKVMVGAAPSKASGLRQARGVSPSRLDTA